MPVKATRRRRYVSGKRSSILDVSSQHKQSFYPGSLPCWHGTVLDRPQTCTGTGTCLSVSEPSGLLSLHPVQAPPAARTALCVLGNPRTADESERNK